MAPRFFRCFYGGSHGDDLPENAAKVHTTGGAPAGDSSDDQKKGGGHVLVELFTSQGCATSPEAELLISRLGRGDLQNEVPVIVLAYHVEYWDYLGWKDPYGSSLWSVRQKAYVEALRMDSIYTPQVVVQGRSQCLGTKEQELLSEIRSAARFPGPNMQATFQRPSQDTLQVSLAGPLRSKVDSKGMDVMAALYESNVVTDCSKGENKGRVLTNDFVVRKLEKLCTVRDISAKKNVNGSITFSLWDGFSSNKCGVVVFVQNSSLQSFGSQHFQLPDNL
ncbi:uncharacterized protein LOC18431667 [Amborella trichopoda]|uniref:DUF1223 domain-containing protein n=1 Tax=Amborella trichopoda TaxID=13333 RepID=W1P7E9_AMBTC|nr:uncharacterized protein LOC18431667 [Amborella trichopoda]ERN03521.1 hypothetical protein AMTR_s00003p00270810 [Amborella trichopoda]|eukprot:XP_006841846.1 uncharacterized protein LOC18431667 [Amborella trichopoda]